MFKARPRELKMIHHMDQGLAGDRDTHGCHISKIRQTHPPRLMHLSEYHILFGDM